jgi:hypothetical protein
MNRPNVKATIEFFREHKEQIDQHFDMADWVELSDDDFHAATSSEGKELGLPPLHMLLRQSTDCGTTGCLAGWVAAAFAPMREVRIKDWARDFLGMTSLDAEVWFFDEAPYDPFFEMNDEEVRPSHVIEALQCAYAEDDWDFWNEEV